MHILYANIDCEFIQKSFSKISYSKLHNNFHIKYEFSIVFINSLTQFIFVNKKFNNFNSYKNNYYGICFVIIILL